MFAKWSYIVMPGKRNDVKESKRRGVRSSAQDFVVFFDFPVQIKRSRSVYEKGVSSRAK